MPLLFVMYNNVDQINCLIAIIKLINIQAFVAFTASQFAMESVKLQHLLKKPQVTAQEVFSVKGINSQIRNNKQKFMMFLQKHKTFTYRMFKLGLNISYEELQEQKIKLASHSIIEFLINEQSCITQLFFRSTTINNSSDIQEKIVQEKQSNIQSEAERLFENEEIISEDQTESAIQHQQDRPIEIQEFQIAKLSLQILTEKSINQTCLGHLYKIYSYLIRNDSSKVLSFFSNNIQCKKLLLSNLKYSSISSLVAQLLTCQDKTREYKHEQFKKEIVQFVIEQMIVNIKDDYLFDGLMNLVDEIFNSTKQSYYEFFQDFKRIANLLVCEETLLRFLKIIYSLEEQSFKNAAKFMQALIARMNTEKQDNSYYNRGEETPTMKFQIAHLKQNIQKLVELIPKIQQFSNIAKISYISFISGLIQNQKKRKHQIDCAAAINCLLSSLNQQNNAGIYKNKIYNLIRIIIEISSEEQISNFLKSNPEIFDTHFKTIRNSNYNNTRQYNKNQSTAFDVAIISQMAKKNDTVIQISSKAIGKDLKRICKKYQTKIAVSFTASNLLLSEDDQSSNSQIIEERVSTNQFGIPSLSLANIVGKNNVSIPVLILPYRKTVHSHLEGQGIEKQNHLIKEKEEWLLENTRSITNTVEAKQIIEEEEVTVFDIKFDASTSIFYQKMQSQPNKENDEPKDQQKRMDETKTKSIKDMDSKAIKSQMKYFLRHREIFL